MLKWKVKAFDETTEQKAGPKKQTSVKYQPEIDVDFTLRNFKSKEYTLSIVVIWEEIRTKSNVKPEK
jgi:hypothetical protein